MEISKTITITNKYGLHARPAMQFVQLAGKYASKVSISKGEKVVDAKSVLDVLTLGANMGSEISIRAEGDDAEEAMAALLEFLTGDIDKD